MSTVSKIQNQPIDLGKPEFTAIQAGDVTDYCDITNSFTPGQTYQLSYEPGKDIQAIVGAILEIMKLDVSIDDYLPVQVSFQVNASGDIAVTEALLGETDFTAFILKQGGGSIQTTYSKKYGASCGTSSTGLAWELSGDFVTWATSFLSDYHTVLGPILLYANYSRRSPYDYLYAQVDKISWPYAQVTKAT